MRGDDVSASNPSRNWAELALSVARIKEIQYEELKCTLVVLTGESDVFEYSGVDLTLPGGGRRHFLGALPERGDLCLVGWAARESSGTASARTPVILGWVPPAPWMGHEWTPFSRYGPGEGLDTPKERATALGTAERVRFKLRHVSPGSVLASSSEGSDLALDDSVLLSNRRGCELVLRDADSSFVARSIAGYAVTSGTRVYSGPVAREARLLPTTMFSDGIWWDAPLPQTGADGTPVDPVTLPASPDPSGFLTPGQIFQRNYFDATFVEGGTEGLAPESRFVEAGGSFPESLDPFSFLAWGGFVLSTGFRGDPDPEDSSVVYGGKPLYRVGITPGSGGLPVTGTVNAHAPPGEGSPDASLTEYRVEVSHTSDGTLPVTEQTDGFDAERLPTGSPADASPFSLSPNRAFVEWVLGSVVGNDPYSVTGRPLYGIPLRPLVFSSGGTSPGLVSALGTPLSEHAATLLRISPPFPGGRESFSSWTKGGAYRARIGAGGTSAQVSVVGGARFDAGGPLSVSGSGGVQINGVSGPGNVGVALTSNDGTVVIRASGTPTSGAATVLDSDPAASSGDTPSVVVSGAAGVSLESARAIRLAAPRISVGDASTLDLRTQSDLSLSSGQRLALNTSSYELSATGGATTVISGPAGSNPANGPSHSFQINATPATGNVGGTTDSYKLTYGDRVEEITLQGSHTTRLTVGDFTFQTVQGNATLLAGTNQLQIDSSSGYSLNLTTGDASATVLAGSYSITAQTGATLEALAGSVTVKGSTGVKLASPGPANGGILAGSDTDPLTGLTYEALGLVPRNQTLAPV